MRGCVTSYRFSLQKIFEKSTFFKFFCIFRIGLTSWLEKWSYFWNLINFQFWPFCHFIDLQLLITTEMLSLSIKFHVSLLSHVIGVKHDCNVVIRPYFQSTPNYVQCDILHSYGFSFVWMNLLLHHLFPHWHLYFQLEYFEKAAAHWT